MKNSQELLDELEKEIAHIEDQRILHEDRIKELKNLLALLRVKVKNLQGIEEELQAIQAEVIRPIREELDEIRDSVGPIRQGLDKLKDESKEGTRYSKAGVFLGKAGLWVGVITLLAAGIFQILTTMDLQRATARASVLHLRLGSGHPNGAYYPVGAAITEVINQSLPDVSMQMMASEASVQNLKDLLEGNIQIAIIQSDVVRAAFLDPEHFEQEYKFKVDPAKIAVMASLYDEKCHIIVRGDSISNYRDMGAKVIDIGEEKSGSRFSSINFLNALNINPGSLKTASFLSPIPNLSNSDVAAFILWEAEGSEQINIELQIGKVKILPLDEDAITKLEAQGAYTRTQIPAATYPHQPEPINTVSVRALLVCSRDLPDDVVRRILAAMYSNPGALSRYHRAGKEITRETMLRGIESFRAAHWLHPASEAYFAKEVEGH